MSHRLMPSVRLAAAIGVVSWMMGAPALAAPIRNHPVTLTQPNGAVLRCFVSGDEYVNWIHDAAGYTIIRDPGTGFYTYAVLEAGVPRASQYVVGSVDPAAAGLQRNALPRRDLMVQRSQASRARVPSTQEIQAAPTNGTINNLVVFIRFSDETDFPAGIETYDAAFNATTSGANSMRAYYQEVSYNQLTISSTFYPTQDQTYTVSFEDSHARGYYQPYNVTTNPDGYQDNSQIDEREHTLLAAALNAIASLVSVGLQLDGNGDGDIDSICFVVRGDPTAWSTLLWPHQSVLYSQTVNINGKRAYRYDFILEASSAVNVLCHEMFHTLGAPDLYHYSSDGLDPVGAWDLMAGGSNPPEHMSAYMKYKYGGWIPSIITLDSSWGTGAHTLWPLTSGPPSNMAYRINSPNSSSEYFVVEYRKRTGTFEASLPGEGMLVYRINTAERGNALGPPDEVYVYRPGGTPTWNGIPTDAVFSADVGRTEINDGTDPSNFLTSGAAGGLWLSDISVKSDGANMAFTVNFAPNLVANGSSITSENFPPPDHAIDPGERVTVSFTVTNFGSVPTTDLVGTLQNTGGVTAASGAQTYGAIAPGASVSRSFSFVASGTCGGPLTATISLQDGTTSHGAAVYAFTLGQMTWALLAESFDAVTAPALPAGWTTAATGGGSAWVTSTTSPFNGANDAFAPNPTATGETELVTPTFHVPYDGTALLTFKNYYDTESEFDGMVLEISIDGGAFADITAGGNAFISGGYNTTLRSDTTNPLAGRPAWTGNSGRYITTSVHLPAAALGHYVQLKWRIGADAYLGRTGVRIDSITVTEFMVHCWVPEPPADFTGDAKSDLLWRHTTQGDMWLWEMNGSAKASENYVAMVNASYTIVAVGDFDEGKADLLWRGTAGDLWLWTMDGAAKVREDYVATVDASYSIVGTGDFDGDGKADLLWRGTAGDLWMWLMSGATRKSELYAGTVQPAYTVKGVGDLDGDGQADLLWQGTAGDLWAWLMNGAARKGEGYVRTVADTNYQIQHVADFDGDRKADVLWRGATAGDLWLWTMNGANVAGEWYVGTVGTTYEIVGTGDFDGDLKTDLLWRGVGGDLWIWLMNGAAKKSEAYAGTVADPGYQIVSLK